MVAEAKAEADRDMATGTPPAVILTSSGDWHPGIVGLIAARLKEHTRRPPSQLRSTATAKAPGRAVPFPVFDLGKLVRGGRGPGCSSRAAAMRWRRD
jgi:single-stranded-DNA-specific exonuclease